MDTLIIYLDDAAYARHLLAPMLSSATPTRWVLVACAPRLSRRVGKWLSHSARENWRSKWCNNLFSQIAPTLQRSTAKSQQEGDTIVECVVAKGPLPELTQQLLSRFSAARVVDVRRPKFGQQMPPVTREQPSEKTGWQLPSAVGTLGVVLVLAAD
jgi:hypothetical protein